MSAATWPEAPTLRRPRILRQWWLDLTFLHWAVEPSSVAHHLPPGTRPDTFEGSTYVGLVPFRMIDTGLPHGPAVPYWGTFLETNIRLYSIDSSGRRGVVFLSLDADRLAVVATARMVFGLPYRWARMTHVADGNHHTYTSTLRWPGVRAAGAVAVRVGPRLEPGPLEHFLTARWGLHTHRAGRTWYLPNHHPPWPLHTAELLAFEDQGLLSSLGLPVLERRPDHIAYSPGVPAEFGLPFRCES
ncbi:MULTISPECIES: YqjF family protein [unclassified Kribbella]|uniref:YqjF family protein n=1 Tax=unclassified Kribbella TaxID=2644121 RepID=UPI003016C81B